MVILLLRHHVYNGENKFKRPKWEKLEYFSIKDEYLEYAKAMERIVHNDDIDNISTLNNKIMQCANNTLKRTLKLKTDTKVKEPPWINEKIRKEIKIRKQYNKDCRRASTEEEKARLKEVYVAKKNKVQKIIKSEIYKHEKRYPKK